MSWRIGANVRRLPSRASIVSARSCRAQCWRRRAYSSFSRMMSSSNLALQGSAKEVSVLARSCRRLRQSALHPILTSFVFEEATSYAFSFQGGLVRRMDAKRH